MGGQNVLVIGGSAGLGKEISKVLVARGDNVTIVARKKAQLDEAREEILLYRRFEIQTVTSTAADMSNIATVNAIPLQRTQFIVDQAHRRKTSYHHSKLSQT
jgi:3-dehydrosphinganine reductase